MIVVRMATGHRMGHVVRMDAVWAAFDIDGDLVGYFPTRRDAALAVITGRAAATERRAA